MKNNTTTITASYGTGKTYSAISSIYKEMAKERKNNERKINTKSKR